MVQRALREREKVEKSARFPTLIGELFAVVLVVVDASLLLRQRSSTRLCALISPDLNPGRLSMQSKYYCGLNEAIPPQLLGDKRSRRLRRRLGSGRREASRMKTPRYSPDKPYLESLLLLEFG